MKTRPALTGVLLMVVGGVWTFQGIGTLGGSFMTGEPIWLWIGIACVVAGLAIVIRGYRTSRR